MGRKRAAETEKVKRGKGKKAKKQGDPQIPSVKGSVITQ